MTWFKKLTQKLKKTSDNLHSGIREITESIPAIKGEILSAESIESVEEMLISSDMSPDTVLLLMEKLSKRRLDSSNWSNEIFCFLREELIQFAKAAECGLFLPKSTKASNGEYQGTRVIMVCGVNGSGKTTTVSKLASKLSAGKDGHSIMIAGCDTFRAAADEQLSLWVNQINELTLFSGKKGEDPSSVAYRAFCEAIEKQKDILIIDTAGRLHNNLNLMQELEKISRVLQKINVSAPHETILVLDGTTGQNIHSQISLFKKSVGVSGVIVTKLDGTAKGGVIIDIGHRYALPIYYIGVGEGVEDLHSFSGQEFVHSILQGQQLSVNQ